MISITIKQSNFFRFLLYYFQSDIRWFIWCCCKNKKFNYIITHRQREKILTAWRHGLSEYRLKRNQNIFVFERYCEYTAFPCRSGRKTILQIYAKSCFPHWTKLHEPFASNAISDLETKACILHPFPSNWHRKSANNFVWYKLQASTRHCVLKIQASVWYTIRPFKFGANQKNWPPSIRLSHPFYIYYAYIHLKRRAHLFRLSFYFQSNWYVRNCVGVWCWIQFPEECDNEPSKM